MFLLLLLYKKCTICCLAVVSLQLVFFELPILYQVLVTTVVTENSVSLLPLCAKALSNSCSSSYIKVWLLYIIIIFNVRDFSSNLIEKVCAAIYPQLTVLDTFGALSNAVLLRIHVIHLSTKALQSIFYLRDDKLHIAVSTD